MQSLTGRLVDPIRPGADQDEINKSLAYRLHCLAAEDGKIIQSVAALESRLRDEVRELKRTLVGKDTFNAWCSKVDEVSRHAHSNTFSY